MNDLLFMVADTNMREAVRGLLERQAAHEVIGCRPFDFDARRDIKVAKGQNDPGLFVRANELLRPFAGEYRHAVLIVDEEWDGSPGATAIDRKLVEHLTSAGWPPPDGLALVVRPEADVWLWSDSPHSAAALGWPSWTELRPALEGQGWMNVGHVKPSCPKEAAEWALRHGAGNVKRSSALYRKVAGKVSVHRCQDSALDTLLSALRQWFPLEGP
jgi:hypothetical protein